MNHTPHHSTKSPKELQQLNEKHFRDDYMKLLSLAGLMIGIQVLVCKPGAMHRTWMAKTIYSLISELLSEG